MATFNYTVDTVPMASEMQSISKHVNATTGAVVAMQTAVIAAENKAADLVCANVNQGFYSLIRSQITQKMAKLKSDVDSHLMQLIQQKKALTSIQNRMQRDYNMISSRYIKLFNGLNNNLRHRIFEIDKPTIDFAIKEKDKLFNRGKYLSGVAPVSQLESISNSQKILASNIKNRGLRVINALKGFLFEMTAQKKLSNHVLIEDGRLQNANDLYVPIVITECVRSANNLDSLEISIPDHGFSSAANSSIKNTVFAKFNDVHWKDQSVINSETKSHFNKLVDESVKSERIKELTKKLFQSCNYKTI